MEHGKIIHELPSSQGVKQGDACGSLYFSVSMKTLYSDAINGLECKAVAIMNDIYFLG